MVVMNERKYSVMELVKMLEEALPKGQVVVVGNGESLTDAQKAWLHNLTDCKGECDCEECDCECDGYTQEELDEAIEEAYEEGKADGYAEGHAECEQTLSEAYDEGYNDAALKVMEALDI